MAWPSLLEKCIERIYLHEAHIHNYCYNEFSCYYNKDQNNHQVSTGDTVCKMGKQWVHSGDIQLYVSAL